jgi:DNA-binding Lrp family transcriptional regulator
VLVGLANHADPDGTGAFPSVQTLMRYTRLSERTVRTTLDRLEEAGVIKPCDPALIAARIKRADQRPKGYDLGLAFVRTDLSDAEVQALSRLFPGLRHRIEAAKNGVQRLHLVTDTGCNERSDGVQPVQERGATVAPEPSLEPSIGTNTPPASQGTPSAERKGARLPDGWQPDVALLAWAAAKGLTEAAVLALWTERFVNHWTASAGRNATKRDWGAAWRNWILEEVTRAEHRAPHGQSTDVFAAAEARALAAERAMTPEPLALAGGTT